MKVSGGAGRVGPISIEGLFASLDGSDIVAVLDAASGIARHVAWAGAVGLGVSLLAAALSDQRFEEDSRVSIGSLAKVHTLDGTFYGVCLTSHVDVELADRQTLQLPTDCILSIKQKWEYSDGLFSTRGLDVNLEVIDGSRHSLSDRGDGGRAGTIKTEALSFLTIGGQRDVGFARWKLKKFLWMKNYELDTGSRLMEVTGVVPRDLDRIRNGLRNAVLNNRERVAALLMNDGRKLLAP